MEFPHQTPAGGRRESGRLGVELIESSLGEVLDLSRSGARIRITKPSDPPPLDLEISLSGFGIDITVPATVRWSRTSSGRDRALEIGLEFGDLDDEQRRQIVSLAMNGRRRLAM